MLVSGEPASACRQPALPRPSGRFRSSALHATLRSKIKRIDQPENLGHVTRKYFWHLPFATFSLILKLLTPTTPVRGARASAYLSATFKSGRDLRPLHSPVVWRLSWTAVEVV
ncbi:hypothetical protein SBA4_3840006 [Candidatus Sulfopaludibacter sp. SbA4]|nr:hypothetical protein SBA4_3840006 [Candidatus Sulfopaludibacter sp. SbA4]